MKKMNVASQKETNGGAQAYCVCCGKRFWAVSKAKVRSKATAHWLANGGNGVRYPHRWNWL